MQTPFGHLTYCTNIHTGESWQDHFKALADNIPLVKQRVCPHQPFGIGLRLSNEASLDLLKEENLSSFRHWLQQQDCYVFTINGFPYGGFHHTVVKDKVHQPDWLTPERVEYTVRLFHLLTHLLPPGMDGGISTSPLSYQHWHTDREGATAAATRNILFIVKHLMEIKRKTRKVLHLDIEPEPDGLIGNGPEFLHWYREHLLPLGIPYLQAEGRVSEAEAVSAIKEHVQLCYDICHFAVGYEDHAAIISELQQQEIKVGKIQISAALKAAMPPDKRVRGEVLNAFASFNESTYLHQVVARKEDGSLQQYPDLPPAFEDAHNEEVREWRSHFHVPLFTPDYGVLQSTQQDIEEVLTLHRQAPFTRHLEIETYTWEVLPPSFRLPLTESIIREVEWVKGRLAVESKTTEN